MGDEIAPQLPSDRAFRDHWWYLICGRRLRLQNISLRVYYKGYIKGFSKAEITMESRRHG